MRGRLSVVVIAWNEEENIGPCLESVAWADEMIVLDSGSTDGTVEAARKAGARVLSAPWEGYGPTKGRALSHATGDWVLSLDADERVSPALREEIEAILQRGAPGSASGQGPASGGGPVGYRIPRRAYFLGKPVRFCGWYPGYVVRLFRREKGRFTPDPVHEEVVVSGPVGTLRGEVLHYTAPTLAHYIAKMNRYTTIAAQEMASAGQRGRLRDLLLRPPATFLRMYLLRLGILDGWRGFLLCLFSSIHVLAKYTKLWTGETSASLRARRRFLVIRADRIGDVILSTPALELLRETYPEAEIALMVRPEVEPVVRHNPHLSRVLCDDRRGRHKGTRGFLRLLGEVRRSGFDVAVLLKPTWRHAALAALAGIPVRIGTGYRPYQPLFTTKVYEHRKGAERHEIDYNLRLLEPLGVRRREALPLVRIPEEARARVRRWRAERGLDTGHRYVVLHPGSGGSARDWPPGGFSALGDRLISQEGVAVVVIGGPGEKGLVGAVAAFMQARPVCTAGELDLLELGALLEGATLVVGNSSGPVHLAAAVGTPVLAFYSPIASAHPRRWGPRGRGPVRVLVPQGLPPCPRCRDWDCPHYDCMAQISVEQAIEEARCLLRAAPSRAEAT